jgi:TRAP-type C4-dicarboxylate transport system permease small subunit
MRVSTRSWVKFLAALLGLVSGFLLFFSFTAVSSDFKPIMSADGAHLCFDEKVPVAGFGGPLVLGSDPCPGWKEGKAAAVVTAERGYFVPLGFVLLMVSFVLQIADILIPDKVKVG